jgi:hypothetical protein
MLRSTAPGVPKRRCQARFQAVIDTRRELIFTHEILQEDERFE